MGDDGEEGMILVSCRDAISICFAAIARGLGGGGKMDGRIKAGECRMVHSAGIRPGWIRRGRIVGRSMWIVGSGNRQNMPDLGKSSIETP